MSVKDCDGNELQVAKASHFGTYDVEAALQRSFEVNPPVVKVVENYHIPKEAGTAKHAVAVFDPATYKAGKLPLDLLRWEAMEETVRVRMEGNKKYHGDNLHLPDRKDLLVAAFRHISKMLFKGEKFDPEWNLHHGAHAIASIMEVVERDLKEKEKA